MYFTKRGKSSEEVRVLVTYRITEKGECALNGIEALDSYTEAVLLIASDGSISTDEVSNLLSIDSERANKILAILDKHGLVAQQEF